MYGIYGYGNKIENIKELKKYHINRITSHENQEAIRAAKSNNIAYAVCTGAFHRDKSSPVGACQFPDGKGIESLSCPNNPETIQKTLHNISIVAADPLIDAITVDACRFPSPANGKSADVFFSCFCDHCMKKMDDLHMDGEGIRHSVAAFFSFVFGTEGRTDSKVEFDLDAHLPNIKAWFLFKEKVITAYFAQLEQTIKSVNKNLLFGAYVFTPCLSLLVGQNYEAIAKYTDFLSPMIYRHYKYDFGPACLDKEVLALYSMLNGKSEADKNLISQCFQKAVGFDLNQFPDYETIRSSGLPHAYIESEVQKASMLLKQKKLCPIILLDDEDLPLAVQAANKGGADALEFFLYEDAHMDKLLTVHPTLI